MAAVFKERDKPVEEVVRNGKGGKFTYEERVTEGIKCRAKVNGEAVDKWMGTGKTGKGSEERNECRCCGTRWSECKLVREIVLERLYSECRVEIVPDN